MESLYASVQPWGTEVEEKIHFPDWKKVDKYQDTVDTSSLSANISDVSPEVARHLNTSV